MKTVLEHFPTEGEPRSWRRIGSGHIHETWLVRTDAGKDYVLQKLNRHVFPDLDAVMGNLSLVDAWARERGRTLPMVRFLDCLDGGKLYDDACGSVWRAYPFVPDSVSLDRAEGDLDLREAARAFGCFLGALSGFPAEMLAEPIRNFHNTPERYRQFRAALEHDAAGRKNQVGHEIAFVLAREERAGELQRMRERGSLPLRVTHNDAKLNNVLLHSQTRRALCVIDLDTVMPGLAAYDFGDLVRSGGARAAEDATDAASVHLEPERFRLLLRGFLAGCPDLTDAERRSLPLGAWTMTLECGLRFLTDHLDGDRYFAVSREGQNLDRARSQFSLVSDMERQWDTIQGILEEEIG